MEEAEFTERPIDEDGLAVDVIARNCSPGAAVVGGTAVIPEHEVLFGSDFEWRHGHSIAVLIKDVVFLQCLSIDADGAG